MADIVTPAVRSRMMAGIRGKDTAPEMVLRRGLHAAGFRYHLHVRDLPGCPDMVFPGPRAVLFAHGCFGMATTATCSNGRRPGPEFWRPKIEKNRADDSRAIEALVADGWRVGVVWECALKGRSRRPLESLLLTSQRGSSLTRRYLNYGVSNDDPSRAFERPVRGRCCQASHPRRDDHEEFQPARIPRDAPAASPVRRR